MLSKPLKFKTISHTLSMSAALVLLNLSGCATAPESDGAQIPSAEINSLPVSESSTTTTTAEIPAGSDQAVILEERIKELDKREARLTSLLAKLDAREADIEDRLLSRQTELDYRQADLETRELEVQRLKAAAQGNSVQVSAGEGTEGDLPPLPKGGECYAKVWNEPKYETKVEHVVEREASERIEVVPAEYKTIQKQVLVQEESKEVRVIPATYKWVDEKVMISPEKEELVEVPPVYETIEEEVVDKPASQEWKKVSIKSLDGSEREIMKLVDIPATYKTIEKQVLKSPASVSKKVIPPTFKTIRKRVLDQAAKTETLTVPSKYKQVEVLQLVKAAEERRVQVPAEYRTIERKILVAEGNVEWRPVVCENQLTRDNVKAIQQALMDRGYNPGEVDGFLGKKTINALNQFQEDNQLPVDKYLNINSLQALGIDLQAMGITASASNAMNEERVAENGGYVKKERPTRTLDASVAAEQKVAQSEAAGVKAPAK